MGRVGAGGDTPLTREVEVSAKHEAQALLGARDCPEQAIRVIDG